MAGPEGAGGEQKNSGAFLRFYPFRSMLDMGSRPLLLQALVFKAVVFLLDDVYLAWRQRSAVASLQTVPVELEAVMSKVCVREAGARPTQGHTQRCDTQMRHTFGVCCLPNLCFH